MCRRPFLFRWTIRFTATKWARTRTSFFSMSSSSASASTSFTATSMTSFPHTTRPLSRWSSFHLDQTGHFSIFSRFSITHTAPHSSTFYGDFNDIPITVLDTEVSQKVEKCVSSFHSSVATTFLGFWPICAFARIFYVFFISFTVVI